MKWVKVRMLPFESTSKMILVRIDLLYGRKSLWIFCDLKTCLKMEALMSEESLGMFRKEKEFKHSESFLLTILN